MKKITAIKDIEISHDVYGYTLKIGSTNLYYPDLKHCLIEALNQKVDINGKTDIESLLTEIRRVENEIAASIKNIGL